MKIIRKKIGGNVLIKFIHTIRSKILNFSKLNNRTKSLILLPLCIVMLATLYLIARPKAAKAAWYNSSWSYRIKLSVDKSKVSGSSTLSDFPVLVSLTNSSLQANAQSDADDILFTSANGQTKLDHEIESYTSASGILVAWVRIPSLLTSANTEIYMYYGNASATSQQNKTGVWDSNYRLIWHMSDTSGQHLDSSSKVHNSTSVSVTTQGSATGKIGGADDFNGTTNTVTSPDHSDYNSSTATIQTWVKFDQLSSVKTTDQFVIDKVNSTSPFLSAVLRFIKLTDTVQACFTNISSSVNCATSSSTLTASAWYHLVAVYDGSNISIYLNGVLNGTPAAMTGTLLDSDGVFRVSGDVNPANFTDGIIDEVRYSGVNRSADWIATEYNNQNSPSTFLTTGQVEQNVSSASNIPPVLYWNFDEGYGTTANDVSGNSNSGTFGASTAAPTIQTEDMCMNGRCLKFDGSNDYVSRTYSSDTDLDPGSSSFSISAWFRHSSTASGTDILIARSNNAINGIGYKAYMYGNGTVCFGTDDDATTFPDEETCTLDSLADSKWHFFEGVKSGTTSITLYIDGKQVGTPDTAISSNSISGTNANFYVGINADGTSNVWDGSIDEVKYFNYAKTSSQILADFESKGNSGQSSTAVGVAESSTSLSNGLVGYWKMDEASWATDCSTTSVLDSSGNGKDGKACPNTSAAAITASGKFGNAGSFDGTNDYVSVTHDDIHRANSTPSVCVWAQQTGAGDGSTSQMLVDKSSGLDAYTLLLEPEGTAVIWRLTKFGSGTVDVTVSATTTSMHHYCGTFDGTTSRLYVDGVLGASAVAQLNMSGNTTELRFGSSTGNDKFFQGKLDDVRLYNRALTSAEISKLYDWSPAPLAHWKMDEDTGTTANDSSGSGYTGTLENGPTWTKAKYGSGVNFDNNDDRIGGLGDVLDIDAGVNFTISGWFYRTDTSSGDVIIAKKNGSGSGNNGYAIYCSSTAVCTAYLADGTNEVTISTGAAVTGQWNHIALVVDRSSNANSHMYINGAERTSTIVGNVSTLGSLANAVNLRLGMYSNSTFGFNGTLDDIKVYNYALNQKQVTKDMNGGHPSVGSPVASALGHWKFDEGSGTVANNSGSCDSACNGTLTSMSSPATSTSGWTNSGKFGKALNFDNTDDEVNAGSSTAIDNLSALTVSAWIYPLSTGETGQGRIIEKTTGWILYLTGTNTIEFVVGYVTTNLDVITVNNSFPTSQWSNIVVSWDGTATASNVKIYVNGNLVSHQTDTNGSGADTDDSAESIHIGNNNGAARTFQGTIDEVKLYGYALNADEVKLDMNQGKSTVIGGGSTNSTNTGVDTSNAREYCVPGDTTTCTAPVAEWKLDEKTGTSISDSSGNNITGTLTNTTNSNWVPAKKSNGIDFVNTASATSGSNQYADFGDTTFLDGATALSASAWVYIDTLPTGGNFISIIRKNTSFTFMQLGGPSDPDSGMRVVLWLPTLNVIPDNDLANWPTNRWVHFAVTWASGGKVKMYRDGINYFTSASTYAGSINNSANNLRFGATEAGTPAEAFDGKLDQVRYWNRELTPAQIAWDYNRGGPQAWWKLDECQGTTANDSSGNGNIGTITLGGSPSIGNCSTSSTAWGNGATGKLNSSLNFDGTDDYVSVNDSATTRQASSFSISAWAYFNSANTGDYIIEKGTAGTANYYIYWWPGQGLDCGFHGGGNWIESDYSWTPTTSTWYHITCVFDDAADTIKTYVNNALVKTSSSITATPDTGANNTYIGRSIVNSDYSMDGKIDDVRLYNYPLTLEQIKLIYNNDAAARFNPSTGSP